VKYLSLAMADFIEKVLTWLSYPVSKVGHSDLALPCCSRRVNQVRWGLAHQPDIYVKVVAEPVDIIFVPDTPGGRTPGPRATAVG